MRKLRNCPFCHKEVPGHYPYLTYCNGLKKWTFNHFCKDETDGYKVSVVLYGETEQEVIDLWNGVQNEP